jgi:hypothetical protein
MSGKPERLAAAHRRRRHSPTVVDYAMTGVSGQEKSSLFVPKLNLLGLAGGGRGSDHPHDHPNTASCGIGQNDIDPVGGAAPIGVGSGRRSTLKWTRILGPGVKLETDRSI